MVIARGFGYYPSSGPRARPAVPVAHRRRFERVFVEGGTFGPSSSREVRLRSWVMNTTSALEGKVALVTGAARGIGAHTARALARHKVRLVLVDLDAEPLHELAAELGPNVAVAVVADVCNLSAVEQAVATGVTRFGGIDLVLANAGMGSYGSVAQTDPLLDVFEVLTCPIANPVENRLTQHWRPPLRKRIVTGRNQLSGAPDCDRLVGRHVDEPTFSLDVGRRRCRSTLRRA